jgi:hypothetical protein
VFDARSASLCRRHEFIYHKGARSEKVTDSFQDTDSGQEGKMKSTILSIMVFVALLILLELATQDQPHERSAHPYYAAQRFHAPFNVDLDKGATKVAEQKNLDSDVSQAALPGCEAPGTACTPGTQSR